MHETDQTFYLKGFISQGRTDYIQQDAEISPSDITNLLHTNLVNSYEVEIKYLINALFRYRRYFKGGPRDRVTLEVKLKKIICAAKVLSILDTALSQQNVARELIKKK